MSEEIGKPKRRNKTPERALSDLMNLCAKGERSSGDAMRLMARWGVDSSERQSVLDKLIEEKFIDDSRYAESYVREKVNLSLWGPRKIAHVLNTKGVARNTINDSLEVFDREMARERLTELLTKRKPQTKAKNAYEMKGKLMQYGASQGYEYDDVMSVVESLVSDDEF